MPFDEDLYDAIYCYTLIHLLYKRDRKKFLSSCYRQLIKHGLMNFVVAAKELSLYGCGTCLSKDHYMLPDGLTVYFYDEESISREFSKFGLIRMTDIEEPIKFAAGTTQCHSNLWYVERVKQPSITTSEDDHTFKRGDHITPLSV